MLVEAPRRCALPEAAITEKREGARGDELVPSMIHNVKKEENLLVKGDNEDKMEEVEEIDEDFDAFESKWMDSLGYGGEVRTNPLVNVEVVTDDEY